MDRVKCNLCKNIVVDKNFCEICGSYLSKFRCRCQNEDIRPSEINLSFLKIENHILYFKLTKCVFFCANCFAKIPIPFEKFGGYLLENSYFLDEIKKEAANQAMHLWYCIKCKKISTDEKCEKCSGDTVVINKINIKNLNYTVEVTQEFFKLQSGIPFFDDLINHGFPYDTSSIFLSPSCEEKEKFEIKYIKKGLINGESTIAAINYDIADFKKKLKEEGINVDEVIEYGLLSIIDLYTCKKEYIRSSQVRDNIVVSAKDLSSLGIAITQALKRLKSGSIKRGLFRILPYVLEVSKNNALDFTRDTLTKLKNNNITSLFTVERGPYDDKLVSFVSELFDGVLELEILKKKSQDTLQIDKKIGVLRMKNTQPDNLYHSITLDGKDLYVL